MESADFNALCGDVLSFIAGTEGDLTVHYLKGVSLTLALVSAVREGNFERHREAERDMAELCIAFDHPNYGRYLRRLKDENREAYNDLIQKGF